MFALKGHRGRVHSLAFSPDGLTLASACTGSWGIHLWNLVTREPRYIDTDHATTSLAFSPDGSRVATGNGVGMLRLWDPGKARLISTQFAYPFPSLDVVDALAFRPDGNSLVIAGPSGFIGQWDVVSSQPLDPLSSGGRRFMSVTFSPDGKILAGADAGRGIKLWDLEKTSRAINILSGRQKAHAVAFSPDGELLAAAMGQVVILWKVVRDLPELGGYIHKTLRGHKGLVWAVAFSRDGQTLATASADQTVRFWDVAKGQQRDVFDWKVGAVSSVAFAPDGMTAAAGGEEGDIYIWDLEHTG